MRTNKGKLIGIIAIAAVIGFSMIACDNSTGGDSGDGTGGVTTYTVTVNGGSGSGSYASGATVTITATVLPGQQFTNWTVNSGGATLGNANSQSTTFTMPANAVIVTANFSGVGSGTYNIGDTGPGGGKIFYKSVTGFTLETAGIIAHYLEATPANIGTFAWASSGYTSTDITGTGTAIGTGMKNTALILNVDANAPAAKVCKDLTLGGKTDWFLPSKDELNEMYKQRSILGISSSGYYWSSSQDSNLNAWLQGFDDGDQFHPYKYSEAGSVRAIRAF